MAEFGIASRLVAPKIDPLAIAGQAQQVQQGALQNRLLNQQIGGKEALGRAITANTGPNGETNWQGGLADLAKDPQGAFAVPELAANVQQRDLMVANIAKARTQAGDAAIDNFGKKLELGANGVIGLLSRGETTKDAATTMVKGLISTGLFNDEHSQKELVGFYQSLGDDPAQNKQLMEAFVMRAKPTLEAIAMTKGNPTQIDSGPQIDIVRTPLLGGKPESVGHVTKGLTPSEEIAPNLNVTDDTGTPGVITKGATAAAQASGQAPAVIKTGPAAGTVEAQQATAKASADQFTADTNDAGGFTQRMQGLNNAEKAIAKATTGKGGQSIQDWGALVNTLAPGLLNDTQKEGLKNFDEARKYLTDYANRRGAALGMGTDAGREMIHAANPSVDINKAAAQDIIKVIKGLERMQNAQVAAANAAHVPAAKYSSWRADWNRSVDPAGFMADQIPAAQRAKLLDKMTDTQVNRYLKGVQAGIDAGYFTKEDLRKK